MNHLLDRQRRFVFRGNAAAIGGRIVRPEDVLLDSHTASSLTVAGGRSSASGSDLEFGKWVRVDRVETSALGVFDKVEHHVDLTYRRVVADALTTSTHVMADVMGLTIRGKPTLTLKHARAELQARSATASGEPSIAPGSNTIIEGLAIDGHELIVELAVPTFQEYDTRAKLLTAADDPDFVRDSGDSLFMRSVLHGVPIPPAGRLLQSYGTIYATIVKSIKWAGTPYDRATIEHHAVIVPDFGTIYIGELLITDVSRRLTMLRFELGSPVGGDVACAEVESNGIWS